MTAKLHYDNKGWRVVINWKGRRKEKRFGNRRNSEKLAQQFAEQVNHLINVGDPWMLTSAIDEKKEEPKKKEITVEEYAKQWLADIEPNLKPATHLSYSQSTEKHIIPEIGSVALVDIDYKLLKTFITKKIAEGYSKNSTRIMIATLSSLLSEASRDGLIRSNPTHSVGRLLAGVRMVKDEVDPFTMEEFEKLELAALQRREVYRDLIAFLFRTGARIGEALVVQFGDINWESEEVRIQRAISCNPRLKGKVGLTKSEYGMRDIDLSPEALDMLQRRKREYLEQTLKDPNLNPKGLIFANNVGKRLDYARFCSFFSNLQLSAGLRHRTIHDLRHSFGSILLSSGAPIGYVAKQMGHAKATTTLRYYSKWMPKEGESYTSILDRKTWQNRGTDKKRQKNEK